MEYDVIQVGETELRGGERSDNVRRKYGQSRRSYKIGLMIYLKQKSIKRSPRL